MAVQSITAKIATSFWHVQRRLMGPITQNKKFKKPRCYVKEGEAMRGDRTRNIKFQMYDSACGTPWFCSIQLFQ